MLFVSSFRWHVPIAAWALTIMPIAANANLSRYQLTAVADSQLDSSTDSVATNQTLSYSSGLVPGNSVFVQTDNGRHSLRITSTRVDRPNTAQGFGNVTERGGANVWSEWLDTFVMNGGAFGTKGQAVFQTKIDGYLAQAAQSLDPYATLNLVVEGLDASFSGANAITYEHKFSKDQPVGSASWSADSFANNILQKSFEFTYGVPFSISSVMSAAAGDGGQVNYQSAAIAGFVLGPNQVLTAFSGTVYPELTAVPVPPALGLFATGLMIGCRLVRRSPGIRWQGAPC